MQGRFSEEFKRAAVARVQSGESQLSVARHLGISSKTLNPLEFKSVLGLGTRAVVNIPLESGYDREGED